MFQTAVAVVAVFNQRMMMSLNSYFGLIPLFLTISLQINSSTVLMNEMIYEMNHTLNCGYEIK